MQEDDLKSFINQHREELFQDLSEEINNNNITDIEWDGEHLWITDLTKGSYISQRKLEKSYVDNLSIRLANIMMTSFNRSNPVLEANTETLRISIWHESHCGSKSVEKYPEAFGFATNP